MRSSMRSAGTDVRAVRSTAKAESKVAHGEESPLPGGRLLAILAFWMAASVAIGTVTFFAARFLGRGTETTPVVVAEVYAIFVGVAFLALRRNVWRGLALAPVSLRTVLLGVLAWAMAYILAATVESAIGSWSSAVAVLRGMGSDDGRLARAGPALAAIILIRACVLAPLGEELLFRGALFTWLRQHLSARWTIGLTSGLFALIHGYPVILPLAFMLGVAAGWIRERSGSTVPSLVAHVVNNVIMVGFSYASSDWTARLPLWGR